MSKQIAELEVARPMLESLFHEVAGVRVLCMHHGISTLTRDEVIFISLAELQRLGEKGTT